MADDFIYSSSFSDKLAEKSKHYKVMNNGSIEVRMVDAEYLIAMKVKSGREAGNDISDIIGILYKEKVISMRRSDISVSSSVCRSKTNDH